MSHHSFNRGCARCCASWPARSQSDLTVPTVVPTGQFRRQAQATTTLWIAKPWKALVRNAQSRHPKIWPLASGGAGAAHKREHRNGRSPHWNPIGLRQRRPRAAHAGHSQQPWRRSMFLGPIEGVEGCQLCATQLIVIFPPENGPAVERPGDRNAIPAGSLEDCHLVSILFDGPISGP